MSETLTVEPEVGSNGHVPTHVPIKDHVVILENGVGRIYVCQPQYSGGAPASHRQFWRGATSKYSGRLNLVDGGGSLLANCFNGFWVHALNLQEDGLPITHFAMLHDDVIPQDGWLDVLMEDLLANKADLVSAVIPIKDSMGLTSTAICGENEFQVHRRLTMTEVYNLPEVFGSEDCGYGQGRLLVNTGCWVCDFRKPWRTAVYDHSEMLAEIDAMRESCSDAFWDKLADLKRRLQLEHGSTKVFFTIRDRVRKSKHPQTGEERWIAEVAPEDWNLSTMIADQGGRVMATRRVVLSHEGKLGYGNTEPWGTLTKDTLTEHRHGGQVVAKPGHEYLNLSVNIEGWLSGQEGATLARLAKGKNVLEIGAYKGKSTVYMARTASMVTTIDTFDARATDAKKKGDSTYQEFLQNLTNHHVRQNVRIFTGTSAKWLPQCEKRFFELVFIDGDHAFEAVKADLLGVLPLLQSGGLIAFHDYANVDWRGVQAVVDQLIGNGLEIVSRVDTMLVTRVADEGAIRRILGGVA